MAVAARRCGSGVVTLRRGKPFIAWASALHGAMTRHQRHRWRYIRVKGMVISIAA